MADECTKETTRRRARNSLTVNEILDAAETVVAEGIDSLTIRAVASELGASPMALYRYLASKDQLIDALLDRVLGRMEPTPPSASALQDLADFARRHRALLMANPWAVAPLIARPLPGPNALPIGEEALSFLSRLGITGDDAVATFSGIVALNYGWASFVIAREELEAAATLQRIDAPPATGFPFTEAVAEMMSRYGADEHYDVVLTQLLTGIEALATRGDFSPSP